MKRTPVQGQLLVEVVVLEALLEESSSDFPSVIHRARDGRLL